MWGSPGEAEAQLGWWAPSRAAGPGQVELQAHRDFGQSGDSQGVTTSTLTASFAGSRGVGKRGGRPPVHTRTPNPGPRDRHWIPRCLPTRGREPTLPCASGALTRGGLLSATWFCRLVIQPGRKLLAPKNSSALRPSGPNAEGRRTPSSGRGCGSSAGGVAGHGSTPALPFGLH